MNVLRFLFGSGWGVLWHLLLYLALLYRPFLSGREMLVYVRKGPGPEGLGVFLILLLEATYVALCSLINATYYVWPQPFSLMKKAGIVLGGAAGLALLVLCAGSIMGEGRVWGFYLFNAAVVTALLVNLWWLYPQR